MAPSATLGFNNGNQWNPNPSTYGTPLHPAAETLQNMSPAVEKLFCFAGGALGGLLVYLAMHSVLKRVLRRNNLGYLTRKSGEGRRFVGMPPREYLYDADNNLIDPTPALSANPWGR